MDKVKLANACEAAFNDEPENGYRVYAIVVYSLRTSDKKIGDEATGQLDVIVSPKIKHPEMLLFDTTKHLFKWLYDKVPGNKDE
jgi:hypothetical protein